MNCNCKRMGIALVLAALCGAFCAYGTTMVESEDLVVTTGLLLTIFYSRVMIGFVIGLSEHVKIVKDKMKNAVLRGAMMGLVVSIGISFYSGAEMIIAFGIVYGIIIDVIATKFS